MKRHAVWILVFLLLSEMGDFSAISLAGGDTWTKKADMPTARWGLSTSVVNDKIYAIGGWKGGTLSTVEVYDPVTDKWTRKADMPTARMYFSTSVVNGKIYAIGGGIDRASAVSTVEEYDPVTDKWAKKANMPTARLALSTSVVDGKIYAIGGRKGGFALSTVEEYAPKTDTWTKKADMPTTRNSLSTSGVNGKIYAIGGENDVLPLSTVEEYAPKTDTWTKKADMPTARWALATSVVHGKIYTIGGATLGGREVVSLSTIEEFDSQTNTWAKKTDMPTAREFLSTSAVNGKIYAIGGSAKGLPLSAVEEYDPGFAGQGVEAKGKLATRWGKLKADN